MRANHSLWTSLALVALSLAPLARAQSIVNVPNYSRGGGPAPWANDPVIPAGTELYARMNNDIGTDSRTRGTTRFTATLETAVLGRRGETIIPAGAVFEGSVRGMHRGMTAAHLAVTIEGLRIGSSFVPVDANIVHSQNETWRSGPRLLEQVRLSAGAQIVVRLTSPIPVAAIERAQQSSAVGGGPR